MFTINWTHNHNFLVCYFHRKNFHSLNKMYCFQSLQHHHQLQVNVKSVPANLSLIFLALSLSSSTNFSLLNNSTNYFVLSRTNNYSSSILESPLSDPCSTKILYYILLILLILYIYVDIIK